MSKNIWDGYHLRISFVPFMPFFTSFVDPTGKERLHGLLGAMLDNVTFSMNISYSLKPPSDAMYGHVDGDGEFHGMPRAVLDGEADLVTGPLIAQDVLFEKLHELSRTRVGFSTGVFTFGLRRDYVTETTSFVDAVDLGVWLGIAVCGAILLLLVSIYKGISSRDRNDGLNGEYILKWGFTFFAILLQEATSSKPPRASVERTARGAWLVGCMFISYAFLGTLRANLVVLQPTERINKMSDFVKFPERPIFAGNGTPAAWLISMFPGAVGDKLREHFANNRIVVSPYERLADVDVLEQVVKSSGAILYEKRAVTYFISHWCVVTPYYFHIMPDILARLQLSLYTSRNLPPELNDELDKRISWVEASGVPFLREQEELNGHLRCMAGTGKKMSENVRQVNIADLTAILQSLYLGLSMSTAVFLMETAQHKILESTQSMQRSRRRFLRRV